MIDQTHSARLRRSHVKRLVIAHREAYHDLAHAVSCPASVPHMDELKKRDKETMEALLDSVCGGPEDAAPCT